MITFPLGVADPGAPKYAGNHERPGVQPAKRDLLRLSQARNRDRYKTA